MNVQMKVHTLRTFITILLVHMHQKKKIALEMAAKIASAKGRQLGTFSRERSIHCFVDNLNSLKMCLLDCMNLRCLLITSSVKI